MQSTQELTKHSRSAELKTRRCPRCCRQLPKSAFWRDRLRPHGCFAICKDCANVRDGRKYRTCRTCRHKKPIKSEFWPSRAICKTCYLVRGLKHCGKCLQLKKLEKFHNNTTANLDGKRSWCKICCKPHDNDVVRVRRNALRRYGLTEQDYEVLLKQQNYCCAVCADTQEEAGGHLLSVDHCHKTGVVRGLLCPRCNAGLGQFRDNPDFLKAAIKYLGRRKNGASRGSKRNLRPTA